MKLVGALALSSMLTVGGMVETAAAAEPLATAEGQAQAGLDPPQTGQRLHWNYPRFRLWQYGLSVAAGGYFFYSVLTEPPNVDWTWRSRGPGDEFAREQLVARGHAGRRKVNNISNRLWHVIELYPLADSLVVPLLFDDFNLDVAWQMTAINLQGIAVMGAINRLTHDFMRRERPALEGCREQGDDYHHYCTTKSTTPKQSFISGHAASVFYGAGATCAHHLALPMYGHRAADIGICALGLTAATAAGALRIVSDAHWMTDVLAGAAAGLGAGWGMAYALHYAMPLQKMHEAGIMLLPIASEEKLELRLLGPL